MPIRHAPQSLQDVLLPQRQIEQTAVNGVLFIRFGVLVASDDLKLCSLEE
jgi:hypothetical protein